MGRKPGIRVAPEHIKTVKEALYYRCFPSQRILAEKLEISLATVHSFLNGKPVAFVNFVDISQALGLDWEAIAYRPKKEQHPPIEPLLPSDTPPEQGQIAEYQTPETHNGNGNGKSKQPNGTLQLLPQPVDANNRGLENYLADRLPMAVSDFTEALKLDPNFAATHYNLGLVYEDLGDLDRARSEYRTAMLGGIAAAYNNLARLYILEKDYATAVDLLLKGLKLASQDAEKYAMRKNLGWARLGQGRYAEAKAELITAIELQGEQGAAHCLLAQTLEAQGKKVDALAAWANCLRYASSYQPDEDAWIDLARQRLSESDNLQ